MNEEIAGLAAQEKAKDKEIALVEKELVGVRQLYDQHLVQISRLTVLERDAARLAGERAQYIASRAQAKGKITETELQIIQVDKDMVSEVSKDLRAGMERGRADVAPPAGRLSGTGTAASRVWWHKAALRRRPDPRAVGFGSIASRRCWRPPGRALASRWQWHP